MHPEPAGPPRGVQPREVARLFRVSAGKVRGWIARGELAAVNTAAACAKPRWVVLPQHLAEFERRRAAGPAPKPPRRKKRTCALDYYPD